MSTFRKIFRDNLGIKIAAIVLSLIIYFHLKTERQDELVFKVPVELKGLPDSLAWTGTAPGHVTVVLNGRLKNLYRLRLYPLRISVDVAGDGPGRFQRTLSSGDVPIPDGSEVAVTRFLGPEEIDILIEKKISRAVLVVPVVAGEPPEGHFLAKLPVAVPESTVVSGPVSIVSSIDSLYTEPIDVSGKIESLPVKAKIDLRGLPLSLAVATVEVFLKFEVESLGVEK